MLWLGSGELQEALSGLCLDFVGTHLDENNHELKAGLGEIIFLVMKFPREKFWLLVFCKAMPG